MLPELPQQQEIESFLAAIRKDWRDDTARLVFADWLQERYPEQADLIAMYRGEARKYVEELCARYDESEDQRGGYGRMSPDHLIEQAVECAAGREGGISFGAAEDLCYAFRAHGEEWAQFWRAIEVLSGYRIPDDARNDVGYGCGC